MILGECGGSNFRSSQESGRSSRQGAVSVEENGIAESKFHTSWVLLAIKAIYATSGGNPKSQAPNPKPRVLLRAWQEVGTALRDAGDMSEIAGELRGFRVLELRVQDKG